MKNIGSKAIVLNNNGDTHAFKKGSVIYLIEMLSEDCYEFNDEEGLIQALLLEHFEWID